MNLAYTLVFFFYIGQRVSALLDGDAVFVSLASVNFVQTLITLFLSRDLGNLWHVDEPCLIASVASPAVINSDRFVVAHTLWAVIILANFINYALVIIPTAACSLSHNTIEEVVLFSVNKQAASERERDKRPH